MENMAENLFLTFIFDQTGTLVTLDYADTDPAEIFKMNDYTLLFCVSVSSVRDELGSIVSDKCKEFGYFLILSKHCNKSYFFNYFCFYFSKSEVIFFGFNQKKHLTFFTPSRFICCECKDSFLKESVFLHMESCLWHKEIINGNSGSLKKLNENSKNNTPKQDLRGFSYILGFEFIFIKFLLLYLLLF